MRFCLFNGNVFYDGMRMGRTKELGMQHARHREVVGEAQGAGDLGAGVDPAARLADYVEPLFHLASARSFAAASSTASTIWL
jgi:hypothetical protein